MRSLKRLYLRLLEWVVILSVLVILLLISTNVFLRYAFNSGIFLAEGVAGLLFVWMTFVGAILVLYEREHIGVDMLVRALPLQLRRVCFVLTHGVMIYASWLLLKGSWAQALINLHVISTATRLPIALLYFAGVAFALASGLFLIWQLVLMLTGKLSDDELVVSAGEDEAEAGRIESEVQSHGFGADAKVSLK